MPLRRGSPLTFRPSTLSDSPDGSNVPPGAMALLANLVPDPGMLGGFVCRPAATPVYDFGGIPNPGFVSGLLVVGDTAYGMIASSLNAGKDQPFSYDINTATLRVVDGITAANTPSSPPASGDWTPPILAQVGSRIVVTHPGFPGGAYKFGWFDVSGFSQTADADTVSGSDSLYGGTAILGVQPGMTISGVGIPAGATVVRTMTDVFALPGGTTSGSAVVTMASTAGVRVGQAAAGVGIPAGATVLSLIANTSVTLSANATATATVTVNFTGTIVVMSAAATASADGVAVTIAGGTIARPLWGAGDVDNVALRQSGGLNPGLPLVPLGVAQMNGRAHFACGVDGIPFSDSGFACRQSNTVAVQALTTNDGLAVTAIGPLMLSAPLTGGIVQALVAFEGATKMQQITGDLSTANLSMNALPVATGTLAPLSVVPSTLGLAFVSPDGLRAVGFDGRVSDPIGEGGTGVTQPFTFARYPSRVCAAHNHDTLRITTLDSRGDGPAVEYWYNLSRRIWTGPHNFPAALIEPWRTSFLMVPVGLNALWASDDHPVAASSFTENGAALSYAYAPTPLPDTGLQAENVLIEMNIAIATSAPVTVTAHDISGTLLDTTTVPPPPGGGSLWGSMIWGTGLWGGAATYQQVPVDWTVPLVFKQLGVSFAGLCDGDLRIAGLYMRYQILGYSLQRAS